MKCKVSWYFVSLWESLGSKAKPKEISIFTDFSHSNTYFYLTCDKSKETMKNEGMYFVLFPWLQTTTLTELTLWCWKIRHGVVICFMPWRILSHGYLWSGKKIMPKWSSERMLSLTKIQPTDFWLPGLFLKPSMFDMSRASNKRHLCHLTHLYTFERLVI